MKRMEVRCCCVPERVYGTVPVPSDTRPGSRVPFQLRPVRTVAELMAAATYDAPATLVLECQTATVPDRRLSFVEYRSALRRIEELPGRPSPAELSLAAQGRVTALKYDGDSLTPAQKLATLRRVQGFEVDPAYAGQVGEQ